MKTTKHEQKRINARNEAEQILTLDEIGDYGIGNALARIVRLTVMDAGYYAFKFKGVRVFVER